MSTTQTAEPKAKIGNASSSSHEVAENSFFASEANEGFFNGLPVQAKLNISPPDDPQEKEADQVADTVMRMPQTPYEGITGTNENSSGSGVQIHRKCAQCEEEEKMQRMPEMPIQRNSEGEEQVNAFSEPAIQRKCAHCEEEEKKMQRKPEGIQREEEDEETIHRSPFSIIQRSCSSCTQEELVQRSPYYTADNLSLIQRECSECTINKPDASELEEEDAQVKEEEHEEGGTAPAAEESVSPKSESGGPAQPGSSFENTLQSSKGSGQPMTPEVSQSMENKFGQDFSHVRIHNNSNASSMSSTINAQAFTHGSDIYFNQNKYDTSSSSGQKLLAHELTHVVQQTGSNAIQPKIQRSEEHKIGNWAHSWIQHRMREKDKELITEAGIPGGTRHGAKINSAGFADFYKSDGSTVSGVQAEIKGENDHYTYKGFMKTGKRLKEMQSKSPIKRGPNIHDKSKKDKTKVWDWNPGFPKTFEVGELKPLFLTDFPGSIGVMGLGIDQKGSYKSGFEQFVDQVNKDAKPPTPVSTSGSYMNLEKIVPDEINYKKFEEQRENEDVNKAIFKGAPTDPKRKRAWVYVVSEGLMLYFLIKHPYKPKEYPEHIDKQLKVLDPLLKKLREAHPTMANSLDTKRMEGTKVVRSVPPTISRKPSGKTIQLSPDASSEKWKKAQKDWETSRKNWVLGTAGAPKPKQFLKEQAQGVIKKGKIDDKLGLPGDKGKGEKQLKDTKSVRFWSSWKGRLFGALRFRFGNTFDKIEAFFVKVKDKFKKHREKADKLKTHGGFGFDWKKTATRIIINLAAEVFKKMISIAFTGFMNCINAIIDNIIKKFSKSIEDTAEKELEKLKPVCCEIMAFKEKADAELAKHDKAITEFTETVEKIQEWRAILSEVEIAVRLGVQIVSCGTPPGLGCLWGLVAQLAISTGLELLSRTDYFKDNIATPAAQKLMDAIVGNALHNAMVDVLSSTPLKEYMAGLEPCARKSDATGSGSGGGIGGGTQKLNPNTAENIKTREQWEADHKDKIMADLQQAFETTDKKPLSEEDVKKILEAMKNSKKTPEEMRKMIEAARNAKTGKLELAKAIASLESGVVPEDKNTTPQGKERKIDYDKAKRNNIAYKEKLGWDPSLFIKRGLNEGTKEFADAVYDMQEAIGVHKDGIAGPSTTVKFYEANNLKKDKVYKKAEEVQNEEKVTKEITEALDKPYPTLAQLKSDLGSAPWSTLGNNSFAFMKVDGRYLAACKTSQGAEFGFYFKWIDSEHDKKPRMMIIDHSPLYARDEIKDGDSWNISLEPADKDKNPSGIFTFFTPVPKDTEFNDSLAIEGLSIEKF